MYDATLPSEIWMHSYCVKITLSVFFPLFFCWGSFTFCVIIMLYQQNCWLLNFICRYIPLKQWAFDDFPSPKYQKFKTDELPVIKTFIRQDWQFLLKYYEWKYHKLLKPIQRHNGSTIPDDVYCPVCGAPHHYIYGNNGQYPK